MINDFEGELTMATRGIGFFDRRGHFFKTADAATASDLSALLGQIGDGERLAPGIAHILLDRRNEIERLFAEHDEMVAESKAAKSAKVVSVGSKVAKLPNREAS